MPYANISKEIQFDAGHRVPNHKSKCRNPHGHRYRVVVHCSGRIIETSGSSDEGMLVDFSDLKSLMTEKIHDVLDHGFIVYRADHILYDVLTKGSCSGTEPNEWKLIEFPYIPTAENIARWCFDQLKQPFKDRFQEDLYLIRVEVWETPTSMASYGGVTLRVHNDTMSEDSYVAKFGYKQ